MRVFMVLEFCGGGTLAEAVDMGDPEVRSGLGLGLEDSEVSVCHISVAV